MITEESETVAEKWRKLVSQTAGEKVFKQNHGIVNRIQQTFRQNLNQTGPDSELRAHVRAYLRLVQQSTREQWEKEFPGATLKPSSFLIDYLRKNIVDFQEVENLMEDECPNWASSYAPKRSRQVSVVTMHGLADSRECMRNWCTRSWQVAHDHQSMQLVCISHAYHTVHAGHEDCHAGRPCMRLIEN